MGTRRPDPSRRYRTTLWPTAMTDLAGPTQRISASYQMPMLMMLSPENARF
jgi:hypothetical protein